MLNEPTEIETEIGCKPVSTNLKSAVAVNLTSDILEGKGELGKPSAQIT